MLDVLITNFYAFPLIIISENCCEQLAVLSPEYQLSMSLTGGMLKAGCKRVLLLLLVSGLLF